MGGEKIWQTDKQPEGWTDERRVDERRKQTIRRTYRQKSRQAE
jgi:hypothetical protein